MRDMQANVDQANSFLAENQRKNEFEHLDRRELSKKSDKDLALFQSQYPAGSPQFVLADHEWQRRLVVEQSKTARLVALVGVCGTLLGAIAGHLLTKW